jgi:predicted metal-binding membrane protein
MTKPADHSELRHLSSAEAQLAHGLARSRLIAIACLVALAGLGWIYLALLVASHMAGEHAAALGPGMSIFDTLARRDVAALAQAIYDAICRPTFGRGSLASISGLRGTSLVFVMWAAMTLAMMLPTAGPMILTYSDIADAAAQKGERAVSPLVLAAGYLAVWLGFALVATALQMVLTQMSLLDPAMGRAGPLFSGALFLAAGAYQFSALKHACVTLCQRPFPFFLANWSTRARGVFALGLRQGLYCLGCCWAMMLLMLAVGVMNVVGMAALGVVMATEKIATTTRFSRLVGGVLALIGVALIGTAILAHWPSRSLS